MEDFEWSVNNESKLFEAMIGHKPVGVNKYFEMLCIWDKMQEFHIDVSSAKIWSHLKTMYNLEALEEIETIPFPNEEKEFYLPELEFGAMKVKKEEKHEDKTPKVNLKRFDNKDSIKTPAVKEEKSTKKDSQRRDSKDGKDGKSNVSTKKEVKKEVPDKSKSTKSRSSSNAKDEDKSKTPSRTDEASKRQNKRPTRGSTKPEDSLSLSARKSQSPLTVTPSSSTKRRRL